jgi:aerobic C4-dicarboxylate transport protein
VPITRYLRLLYVQVLIAIAIGIVVGYFWPQTGASLEWLGKDFFIKLVKMIIAPVIFCTVVLGIAGMENLKSVGRTGGLAIIYFEVLSTVALVIGMVVVNVIQPGAGMNFVPSAKDIADVAARTSGKAPTVTSFLTDIIPESFFGALAKGEILPVLLVAILTGFALHLSGERVKPLFSIFEQFSVVLFRIVGFIMRLAPVGAFGAMAFTVGKYGLASLTSLGGLMACFYLTCILFVFIVLGIVARLHGFSIWRFLVYIREELLIVLGASSSEAALPRLMSKLESLGAHRSVVGLVVPAGYSFNLDGTSIYLTMATLFIAQASNTPLDLIQQLTILGVLLLTSKGAAGVTGSGFIVLVSTLAAVPSVPIPVSAIALILGIDRFMSEARAITNFIGNGVATLVVARWCNALNGATLSHRLAQGPDAELPSR